MAASCCPSRLRLLLGKSPTLSYKIAYRRFTLSSVQQQKKKSSKKNRIDFDDLLSTAAAEKSSKVVGRNDAKVNTSRQSREDFDTKTSSRLIQAPSFKHILHERYTQARRSVIIRTQNPDSTMQSLLSIGGLKHAQFTSQDKSYILAEFASEESIIRLQYGAGFFAEPNQFPMRSRILFDTSTRMQKKRTPIPEVLEVNWHEKSSKLYPVMDSLEQEFQELCARRSLADSDLRLRFFVCYQLEELLQSVLPEALVIPYGSCMNGFGWWDSDLDMMLCFNKEHYVANVVRPSEQNGRTSNFKILTETFSSSRHLAQRSLAMVASLLELTPRVINVFKILNARVPIVRFKQIAANLNCDISIQAMDSIKMTELLYLYSVCDPRVKPLMCVIKQWAICNNQTSSGEQQKPTTIGLLMMLIFYLQTRSTQVLPTLRKIQALANATDMFYIDNVMYGLPSSPASLPRSQNTESIESLLLGFFHFYSEFDFRNKAISIIEGDAFIKPADSTPVHIENPLCIGLNICRNVGQAQLNLFTSAMKEAAKKLETLSGDRNGLSSLAGTAQGSRLSTLFAGSHGSEPAVSVEISKLFDEADLADGGIDDAVNKEGETQTGDQFGLGTRYTDNSSNFESPLGKNRTSSSVKCVLEMQDDKTDTSFGNLNLSTASDQANTQPVSVQANTQPVSDQANTQPVSDQANTQPVSDQANTQPVSDQANTQPVSDQANTQPVSDQANTQPVSDHLVAHKLS